MKKQKPTRRQWFYLEEFLYFFSLQEVLAEKQTSHENQRLWVVLGCGVLVMLTACRWQPQISASDGSLAPLSHFLCMIVRSLSFYDKILLKQNLPLGCVVLFVYLLIASLYPLHKKLFKSHSSQLPERSVSTVKSL